MPLGLKAIYPKTKLPPDPAAIAPAVTKALQRMGLAFVAKMQQYPPQQPPINPKRRRYQRTGDLGRGWTSPGAIRVTGNTVTVVNRMTRGGVSYPVYVQGPKSGNKGERQTAVMKRKGWQSVSDVAKEVAKENRPILNRAIVGRQ